MPITRKNIGDRFDDFLQKEGIYEECTEAVVKRLLALQLDDLMKKKHLTKTDMARRIENKQGGNQQAA